MIKNVSGTCRGCPLHCSAAYLAGCTTLSEHVIEQGMSLVQLEHAKEQRHGEYWWRLSDSYDKGRLPQINKDP